MIKAVEEWYKKEISKTTRHFFDTHFKHHFMIKPSQICTILANEMAEVGAAYNIHVASEYSSEKGSNPMTALPMMPEDTKEIYNICVKEFPIKLTPSFIYEKLTKSEFGGAIPGGIKQNDVFRSGRGVMVRLQKGQIGITAADVSGKDDYKEYRLLFNTALKTIYTQFRTHCKAKIIKDYDIQYKKSKAKEIPKYPKSKQEKYPSQLVRSHGQTQVEGEDLVAKKGGRQTTIAVLSLARNFDKFDRGNATAKKAEKKALDIIQNTEIFDEITEMMKNALEIEYQITDIKNLSDDEFSEYEIVKMELSDKKGNKVLNHYDTDGIKRFLKNNREKFAKKLAESRAIDFGDAKSSAKKKDVLRRMAMKSFIANYLNHGHSMNPNLKYKVNQQILKEAGAIQYKGRKTTNVITNKKRKITKSSTSRKGKGVGLSSFATMTNAQRAGGQPRTADASSPAKLQNILNQLLPIEVAKNMQSPALRFRTGRLANSARVVGINQGPRGGTQINYTYMRDPYETFEPGGEMGSTLRDPRRLIGGTIREIMQTKFRQRFIKTRSV